MINAVKVLSLGVLIVMTSTAQNRIEFTGIQTVTERPSRFAGMSNEVTDGMVRIHGPNNLLYEAKLPDLTMNVKAERTAEGYVFHVTHSGSIKFVSVLSRQYNDASSYTEEPDEATGGYRLEIKTATLPEDLTLMVSAHDPHDVVFHSLSGQYPISFVEYIGNVMGALHTKRFSVRDLLGPRY
jgi:hypothetical protein